MNDTARFLAALFDHDDIVEVRFLPSTRSIWSTPADFEGIEGELTRQNDAGENVYIGANPRRAKGGTTAADVALARAVCADFDNGTTPAEALARVAAAGLPVPTVVVASGGGAHCWWRLAEPLQDLKRWTAIQKGIIRATGSDTKIHDPPRIMRLPGYRNRKPKYPDAPMAEIVDCDPERVYPVDVFDVALPAVVEAPRPPRPAAVTPGSMSEHSRRFLEEGIHGTEGRAVTAFEVACDLAGRGWSEAEAAAAILPRCESLGIAGDELARDIPRQIHNAFKAPRDPRGGDALPPIPEWVPFPVATLPDPIRTYTVEAAAGIGVDPSMIALPLLTAAAAAIGNSRRVEVRPGWIEPPVIWSAIVAESGSGKTPALSAALRFVHEVQAERFRDHGAAMADHEADVAAHEKQVTAWRRSKNKADAAHPGPPPSPPTAERFVTSDITTEALAVLLGANPRGVLVAVDELAGWFGGFDAYRSGRGGADAPRWLSMHSAGPVTVDRKGSGALFVPSAAVSVTGGIQPGTLVGALGQRHVENGMLARLVLTMPPRLPRKWTTTAPGFATVDAMTRLWGTLLTIPVPATGPRVLDLSPDAVPLFVDWYGEIGAEQSATTGPVASMLSKVEALAARLALVVHVVRQAHGDTDAGDRIDAVSMSAGIALARWAAGEARRVYRVLLADGAASTTTQDDEAAVQWIEARGGFATIRDIGHGLTRFKAPGAAEAVCRRLVASGRATREVATTGGRPADGIRLVGRSMAAAG